jgi:hypothetical protein
MSLTVQTAVRRGVSIVVVDGVVDRGLTTQIGAAVRTLALDAETVVVDLSEATLASADVTRELASGLTGLARRVAVVNRRLSARRVLRRFGDPSIPLFASVEAALGSRLAS